MAIRVYVYAALMLVVTAYALIRGGRPEQSGALIWAMTYVLSFVAVSLPLHANGGSITLLPLVDIISLAAFVALAVQALPFWLRWVVALQLLTVATHLTAFIAPEVQPWAYRIFVYGAGWPIVILIAVGTRAHVMRQQGASAHDSSHA